MATPVGGFDPGGWQLADRRAKGGRADATERSNGAGQSAGIRPSLAGAEMGRTNGGMGARMDAVEWPTGAQGKALGQALPSGPPNGVASEGEWADAQIGAASKPVGGCPGHWAVRWSVCASRRGRLRRGLGRAAGAFGMRLMMSCNE